MDFVYSPYFGLFFSMCILFLGILYSIGFVSLCSYYLRKLRYRLGHKQTLCDIVLDELQPKCTSFSIKRSRKPLKRDAAGLYYSSYYSSYYGLDSRIVLGPSTDAGVFLHEVGHLLVHLGSYNLFEFEFAPGGRFTEESICKLFCTLIFCDGDINSTMEIAKELAEIHTLAKTRLRSVHWGCAVEIGVLDISQ